MTVSAVCVCVCVCVCVSVCVCVCVRACVRLRVFRASCVEGKYEVNIGKYEVNIGKYEVNTSTTTALFSITYLVCKVCCHQNSAWS